MNLYQVAPIWTTTKPTQTIGQMFNGKDIDLPTYLMKFFLICNRIARYAEFFFDKNPSFGVTNATTWFVTIVGVRESTEAVVFSAPILVALKQVNTPSHTFDNATCERLKQTKE